MVLSQLCRVKADSMQRYAYGSSDSSNTNASVSTSVSVSDAGPGPDPRVLLHGGSLRDSDIQGIIQRDQQVLRRYFGKAGIPVAAAAVLAAAAGGSSSSAGSGSGSSSTAVSETVLRVRSSELWQHLQRTTRAPGDFAAKQLLLINALKAAHLWQTDTMQYGVQHSLARLKHCSLFVAVAQVLGAVVPQLQGRRTLSTEQFISVESPTAQDEKLQLALKLFAACLADLAGATATISTVDSASQSSSSSSSSSSSIDDAYVKSVLQAYLVDDVVELVDALWLGARDVHPILVSLLSRLLPVNIQVCCSLLIACN
jgi:hypothetical protein